MKVRWTEQAFERLAEIQDYIGRDNPTAASRMIERIIDRAEALDRFPERGRIVPEIGNSNVREVFEGSYRIVYRVHKQGIQILTVFEGHRLLSERDLKTSE